MEQPMRCKTLTAIYKNEINTLKKLYEIDFLIHKSVRIHIEQFTVRKIEIDFTSEQLVDDLIAVLTKVERLLMLFDGYFMNLISIEFQDSAGWSRFLFVTMIKHSHSQCSKGSYHCRPIPANP